MSISIMNECYINGVQYKCRTCFDPGSTVYALADECRSSKTWRDLLNDVAKLETNDDELLPRTICCKCLDKLISYYDFILQIQNVNKKYSQLLTSGTDSTQDGIPSNFENFTDCLAESAIALPSYVSEIKVEDEQIVPYDIVSNNVKINADRSYNSANEDDYDPFKETLNDDVKSSVEEQQKTQRSINEETNELFRDDYTDDTSSTSSGESDYQAEKRMKTEKVKKNSTSMKRSRMANEIDENEPISEKKCKDCFEIKSYIHGLFTQQTEKLCKQNKKIMEVLAEQNVLTHLLIKQDETSNHISKSFPISSEASLIDVDEQINAHNKHLYVTAMKDIIKNNFIRNIGLIISEDILYAYNLDGTHGKNRLKDFKNLYSAIEEAVKANPDIDDIEGNIRKAINLIKKRHLKKILKERELKIRPCMQDPESQAANTVAAVDIAAEDVKNLSNIFIWEQTYKQFGQKKGEGGTTSKVYNSFVCNICMKSFSLLSKLCRHIKTKHENKTNFSNESGSSSSAESDYVLPTSQLFEESTEEKYREYFQIEKVNNHFVCPMCKKGYTLQRNCRRHIMTIHCPRRTFPCGFCTQHLKCKDYLIAHIKRMHPGESFDSNRKQLAISFGDRLYSKPVPCSLAECKLCATTFITAKELREHLEHHTDLSTLNSLELSSGIIQHWFSNMSDLKAIKEIICKDIQEKNWFKYYTVLNEFSLEISISDTDAEDLEEETAERVGTSKYTCELCANEFSYKYQVFDHLKEDHVKEEIPLKCSRCKLEFISIEMYEQHRHTHCRNKHKILNCAHCPAKFVWLENMKNHKCIRKILDKENHQWNDKVSDAEFNVKCSTQELETSNANIPLSPKTLIRCGLCELSFKKLRDLRQHMPLHADGKTGIDINDCIYVKQFVNLKSIDHTALQQQIKNSFIKRQISCFYQAIDAYGNEIDISDSDSNDDAAGNKCYMCELCKEMFKKRKLLFNHQKEHHNDVSMPFTCKDCKLEYVSIHLLQQHLKRECWNEHRRTAAQCDYCNMRFIWPLNMLKHKEIQHNIGGIENSERNELSHTQPNKANSATVKLSTSAEVQIRYCFLCPKTFFGIDQLNDHLRQHRLTPSSIKTVESIVHSTWWPNGKKIIKCKICDLVFLNMAQLNEHFSPENPQNLCARQHSLANYSITNQKGFELHLELDSETETENIENAGHDKNILLPYACCMCSRSFRRKYQMAQHQRSMHNYELLEFKCERCLFRTVSQKVLDYHRITQCFNVEKEYKCDHCSFKFMWQENLDNHISLFHTAKGFARELDTINSAISKDSVQTNTECLDSEEVANDDLQPTSNKNVSNSGDCMKPKSIPKKKVQCPICGVYTTSGNLSVHIRRHKGDKPYRCNFCEMFFARNADLVEHKRKHTGDRPFKCTICEKSYNRQSALDVHIRSHTGERPYQCTTCQKSFCRSEYLKLHMRRHTGEKPHICNICGKGFLCASYLKTHRQMRGHNELFWTPDKNPDSNVSKPPTGEEERKMLCPICGAYLANKTSLSRHIRLHNGEIKCDICDKHCNSNSNLKSHRTTHFSERPYKCTVCDKSFAETHRLTVHMRTHTGDTPYQCNICQKKFNRSCYLKLHLLNHTGEKPFRCEICDQSFKCLAYLKKHRVKIHFDLENS